MSLVWGVQISREAPSYFHFLHFPFLHLFESAVTVTRTRGERVGRPVVEAIAGELGGQHDEGVMPKPGGVRIHAVVAVNLHDGGGVVAERARPTCVW